MIQINLVSPQLRKKKKTGLLSGGSGIPPEIVIGSGGGLFILLIVTHLVLLFVSSTKLIRQKTLNNEWEKILPQKGNVDLVVNQMREFQGILKTINNITKKDGIRWAQKLNIISDSLPKGVWLKRLALDDGVLFIEGSAISKQQKEMINAHSFTSLLKEDKSFLTHLNDLELGSVQRQKIQNLEVADFLITAKVNENSTTQ